MQTQTERDAIRAAVEAAKAESVGKPDPKRKRRPGWNFAAMPESVLAAS